MADRIKLKLSRRTFCVTATAGVGAGLLVASIPACDSGTGGGDMAGASADMGPAQCGSGSINAGAASGYTVGGTPKYFPGGELFVIRDTGGLYAVSAICTHAGCTIQISGSKFSCPCHGATFALDGSQPTPPAFSPLPHYAICVDASGNVTVDPRTSVPSSNRY